MLANVVKGEDIGMTECSDGTGLLLKAAQALGVGGKRRREDLHGDFTA